MLGELFADLFKDVLKEFVFIPLTYLAGKPIVWLFSLGTLHTTLDEPPVQKKKKKQPPPQPQGLTFVRNGRRYLDYRMTALVGLIFWVAVIVLIVFGHRGPTPDVGSSTASSPVAERLDRVYDAMTSSPSTCAA